MTTRQAAADEATRDAQRAAARAVIVATADRRRLHAAQLAARYAVRRAQATRLTARPAPGA